MDWPRSCATPWEQVVCDNLKAAVTNPDRFDPGLNRTYAEMAGHYGTAILAACRVASRNFATVCLIQNVTHSPGMRDLKRPIALGCRLLR